MDGGSAEVLCRQQLERGRELTHVQVKKCLFPSRRQCEVEAAGGAQAGAAGHFTGAADRRMAKISILNTDIWMYLQDDPHGC